MSERLLSVGLDVGTTSTQLIFSELLVENRAGSFSVPEMEIGERKILYKSPVHFTPLLSGDLVDAGALRRIVDGEYARAGFQKSDVDTGAIIITGETSRKENARAVLTELSGYAGDFVVATAGPDLESVLAAKGAGATALSERTGRTVLHFDIGGGTSNLALIQDGKITATGCLNVGGRLLKFDEDCRVTYVSPVLEGLCSLKVGKTAQETDVAAVAQNLTRALEMAAGLREPTELLDKLWTKENHVIGSRSTASRAKSRRFAAVALETRLRAQWRGDPAGPGDLVISFSGGVADCIERDQPWLAFGDMGPILGRAIRASRLCRGEYVLGEETIRATVIGAGCHSAQLSGSTVFHRNVDFPLKNLPVIRLEQPEATAIRRELAKQEDNAVLALPGPPAPSYAEVYALAETLEAGFGEKPILVCLEQDMAKALGQALAVRLPGSRPILCIDRVRLTGESYLDVGAPVGPALPVVIKTLVLSG